MFLKFFEKLLMKISVELFLLLFFKAIKMIKKLKNKKQPPVQK